MDLIERYKQLTHPHPYWVAAISGSLIGVLIMSSARDFHSGVWCAIGIAIVYMFYTVGTVWERKR